MYETLTFTGGIHKSEELKELIEDLGGFVLQSNIQYGRFGSWSW